MTVAIALALEPHVRAAPATGAFAAAGALPLYRTTDHPDRFVPTGPEISIDSPASVLALS